MAMEYSENRNHSGNEDYITNDMYVRNARLQDDEWEYNPGCNVDEDGVIQENEQNTDSERFEFIPEIETRLIAVTGRPLDLDQMVDMISSSGMNYVQFTEPQLADDLSRVVQLLEVRTGRRERSGLPWTSDEDAQLEAELASGMSIKKIAELHKRSNYAISMRIKDQGIKNQEVISNNF